MEAGGRCAACCRQLPAARLLLPSGGFALPCHQLAHHSLRRAVCPVLQEVGIQARMAVPLAVGHLTNMLLSVISLAFVGQLGQAELAAAALGNTLYMLVCRVAMAGL